MKTMKDYFNSDANTFEEFFLVGDIVGKDVVEEFRNCLLPATDNAFLMQMGEPYSHINGKATYMTFASTPEGWQYRGNCFKGEEYNPFTKWLNTFLNEKGVDLSREFKQTNEDGISMTFSYQEIVDQIKCSPEEEQEGIQSMLVKIDFANGDVLDYFRHLSKALIPSKEEVVTLEETFGKSLGIDKENLNEREEEDDER